MALNTHPKPNQMGAVYDYGNVGTTTPVDYGEQIDTTPVDSPAPPSSDAMAMNKDPEPMDCAMVGGSASMDHNSSGMSSASS